MGNNLSAVLQKSWASRPSDLSSFVALEKETHCTIELPSFEKPLPLCVFFLSHAILFKKIQLTLKSSISLAARGVSGLAVSPRGPKKVSDYLDDVLTWCSKPRMSFQQFSDLLPVLDCARSRKAIWARLKPTSSKKVWTLTFGRMFFW